jgi:hypothetical protein
MDDYKRGFGSEIGFIDNLHVVAITLSLIFTLYKSQQHMLSLFGLLSPAVSS